MQGRLSGVRRLAGTSGALLAGRVGGAGANFLFSILLARALAPQEAGAAFAIIAASFLASVFVTLNVESGSIRFLVAAKEAGRRDVVNGFVTLCRMVWLAASPIVVALFVFACLAAQGPERTLAIVCAGASIPAMGWMRLSGAHATALGRPVAGSLPRTVLQPSLLLAFFAGAMLAGAPASADTALACFFAAFATGAAVQFLLLRRRLFEPHGRERSFEDWRNWMLNGFYMSPLIMLQDYLQHLVVAAAALALAGPDVAVIAISLRFISLIRFGVLSVNMAASPGLSRAIARDDRQARDRQLRAAALIKAPAAIVASLAVIAFSGPILSLFGETYIGGKAALGWFTAIPLAAALFGPNQMLLNISGARAWVFALSLAAIGALCAGVPLTARAGGVAAAAMTVAIVYAGWEAALFAVVRTRLGVDASVLAAVRPAR